MSLFIGLVMIGVSLMLDRRPVRGFIVVIAAICALGHDQPQVQPAPQVQEQRATPPPPPPQRNVVPQPPKRWTI